MLQCYLEISKIRNVDVFMQFAQFRDIYSVFIEESFPKING